MEQEQQWCTTNVFKNGMRLRFWDIIRFEVSRWEIKVLEWVCVFMEEEQERHKNGAQQMFLKMVQ